MTAARATTGPESIVVSLEYAKKLKEAGWPQQETLFVWRHDLFKFRPVLRKLTSHIRTSDRKSPYFAAPTAEEILRRLPERNPARTIKGAPGRLTTESRGTHWVVGYGKKLSAPHITDTLANAAAAMYCHLAEQGLLPSQ